MRGNANRLQSGWAKDTAAALGSRNHAATALRVAAAKIPKFVQYLFLAMLWFVVIAQALRMAISFEDA